MALVGRTQIGIRATGAVVTVPNNNKAKLMYYLNCVCTVLDLDDNADINRLRRYRDYILTADETDRLLHLCYLLRLVSRIDFFHECTF